MLELIFLAWLIKYLIFNMNIKLLYIEEDIVHTYMRNIRKYI